MEDAKKPCGTWERTDIPEAEVGKVIAAFKADGAKKINKKKQPDGKWTVTAIFDPCAAGKPQKTTKKHKG